MGVPGSLPKSLNGVPGVGGTVSSLLPLCPFPFPGRLEGVDIADRGVEGTK